MRDRLDRRNLRLTFDSFGRDLKGPREDQRDAIQLHEARGRKVESVLEKPLRGARASRIYSGTSEIQKMILAAYVDL